VEIAKKSRLKGADMTDEITLNVAFASTEQSLHEMFAAVLGFPGYYGMNWNAFWDCVTDPEQSSMPGHLVLKGMTHLERRLPEEARQLRIIVKDLEAERPDIKTSLRE
jgi:ribonuclease inhibitor